VDHEFELAFNLLDEAAERIQHQQYGITRVLFHNQGLVDLTTVHNYSRHAGHRLVLFAFDDYGQMAAVEATAPDLNTTPRMRILKVRAGERTFHAVPGQDWCYSTTHAGHTYTLTAGIGEQPMWTVTVDADPPAAHENLQAAIDHIADAGLLVP
jgi:hypothetical protein